QLGQSSHKGGRAAAARRVFKHHVVKDLVKRPVWYLDIPQLLPGHRNIDPQYGRQMFATRFAARPPADVTGRDPGSLPRLNRFQAAMNMPVHAKIDAGDFARANSPLIVTGDQNVMMRQPDY